MHSESTAHGETAKAPPAAAKGYVTPGEARTSSEKLVIETRIGIVEVNAKNALRFPNGLLGFADATEFSLIDLEDARFSNFRILQCLNEPELSFIVLPLNLENGAIDSDDLESAREALGIAADDLLVLLLITARKASDGVTLTANLRAPIIIDAERFTGVQYVLPNDKYPIRFKLSDERETESEQSDGVDAA